MEMKRQRYYYWKSLKNKYLSFRQNEEGFTLLETLVSLAITLLCFSLITIGYNYFQRVQSQGEQDKQIEFHLFLHQLEQDIKDKEFVRHTQNELRFHQTNEHGAVQAVRYTKDLWVFKRTVADQGYQPMLTDVHTTRFLLEGNFLHVMILFRDGEEYEALLDLSENRNETME